jgi:GSH-dependent disulfide-bond oxidoreductase
VIELYTFPTANGLRASIALEESGLPYHATRVNMPKGETKSPEFLKLNPAGLIPVIVDEHGPGGSKVTLAQSNAILLYVAEKAGKFIPKDVTKRLHMFERWTAVMTDVGAANNAANQSIRSMKEKHQPTIDFFGDKLIDEFKYWDRVLKDDEYLAGELTIADFSLYPTYARAKAVIQRPEAYAALPNLERWAAAMAARPGVERGMKVGVVAPS